MYPNFTYQVAYHPVGHLISKVFIQKKLDALENIFVALEQIKCGLVSDPRHTFKQKLVPSPTIWVFTNHQPPNLHVFSTDRWKIMNTDPIAVHGQFCKPYSVAHVKHGWTVAHLTMCVGRDCNNVFFYIVVDHFDEPLF